MTPIRSALLLMTIFISQCLLAQPAPPILRQPLTTNGHFGPLPTDGQVPIWNAAAQKWSNNIISAGSAGLTTNANQFLGVPLSIKDGALLTNLIVQTSFKVSNGFVYVVGPVTNGLQLNLPHLTASRSAIINAQGDITNSSADSNWSIYSTNVWNDRQGGSLILTNLAGTGALTNADVFQPANANLTNWALYPTNVWNDRQFGSQNLTNWSNIPTGAMANVVSTTFLTNWANAISNYVTAATNSASVTNWITTRQPASANLTNWSNIPTGAMANVVATDYLTNWANAISNLAQTKQHGSSTLTNLSGTGAITNVFSASLSNATMKPVVFPSANNFATNYTGRFFGLEAGGNVTLTPNGSNIVIAASVSGSGVSTNSNQFGASVELTIKDGAFLTNLNVETSLQVSNGHTYLAGPVTNLTQLNLPHLTVSRSAIINAQGDVTNSSADSNWSLYTTNVWNDRQGGSQNLTNWSNIPTGAMANVVSTTFLTNWANAVSNYVTAATNSASVTNWIGSRQPASTILTNLSGTGAITNLFSPTLSNATIKPLVVGVGDAAGATNTTGEIRGIQAGANITLTENGSNYVIASTGGGGVAFSDLLWTNEPSGRIHPVVFTNRVEVQTPITIGTNSQTFALAPNSNDILFAYRDITKSERWNPRFEIGVFSNSAYSIAFFTLGQKDSGIDFDTVDENGNLSSAVIHARSETGPGGDPEITLITTNGFIPFSTRRATNLVLNNITYQFPFSQGAAGTVLTNDGTGALGWGIDQTSAGGGSLTTNANQFLGVPLSIIKEAKLTNTAFHGGITMTNSDSQVQVLRVDSTATTNALSVGSNGIVSIKGTTRWVNIGESSDPGAVGIEIGSASPVTPSIARAGLFSGGGNLSLGYNSTAGALFITGNANYKMSIGAGGTDGFLGVGMTTETPSALLSVGPGSKFQVDSDGDVRTHRGIVVTNIPGQIDPLLRLEQTNGRGYAEFTTTNSVIATNRFVFSIGSNTVSAGQVAKVHSTTISGGVNTIVLTNDADSGGGSVTYSDLVWTNDAGTIKPNAFPTNVLLRVDVPDDGVGTNFYWDATTYRANGASKLFALYNGGSNALTIGPFGGIHIGRAAAAATPALGNVLSVDYDTVLGEPGTAVINWNARQSAVGYFGNGSFSTSTNQSNLNINSFDGVSLASAFDVTSRYTNITFTLHGQNASGIRGIRLSPMSPTIGLTVPTNYLFNSFYRLTNIHTLFSLQNSNTPMFEVNGIGDLKLLKRIPYSWPSAQGAAQTVLTNDGSGNLGWGAVVVGGPAAITNLISLTLSNATIKPLVVGVGDAAGATNVTGNIRGLEAGTGITLTPNGSNYVIASTATGGGITTNANQFAASVELAIKSGALLTNTLHYPSNLTSPAVIQLASVGQGTNLTEWRGTNGLIGLAVSSNGLAWVQTRLDLANAVAFRTNQIDLKLNTYQAFNTALVTNLMLQLTNALEGVTTRLDAYGNGRLGGGRTNAWQLLCVVPTGVNIYWPPGTTNGNYDVLVNSNQLVSFTFLVGLGSTNILASYRVLEGIGAN